MTDFMYTSIAEDGYDFDSEAFHTVAHDNETNTLYVHFQSGGEYIYEGVLESTYNTFIDAPSLGRFWRQHISGNYTSEAAPSGAVLTRRPRVEAEQVDLKPETKWLTAEFADRDSGDEPEPEPPAEPLFRKGDRVTITYGHGWDGPGTVEQDVWPLLGSTRSPIALVRRDEDGNSMAGSLGGFALHQFAPLVEPEPQAPTGTSTYGIRWTCDVLDAAGPFEPQYEAKDEAEALEFFHSDMKVLNTTMPDTSVNAKIVSVTHYFV